MANPETTSSLSGNLHSYYHKMLLETAKSNLKLWGLGKKKMHPKGNGVDSFMLKFGHVAASVSELSEGVVPSSATIKTNKYTVTVKQYGQYISLSDWLILTAVDPVLEDVSEELGYTAALSTDRIVRDHLVANATTLIQYVGSGNSTDNDIAANETFVALDAQKAVRELDAQDAPTIDGDYVWVVHPRIAHDIMGDTSAGGFIELNKYVAGLADKPLNGEIGKVYGARIVKSSNISSAANSGSVNVYRTLMLAKDAFACTSFDKDHIDLIVKQAGSAGTADPLNQIATAGYKLQFGVKYVGGGFSGDNDSSPDLCLQIRGAATGG
jgi:N4-gp56 family major capsid protein